MQSYFLHKSDVAAAPIICLLSGEEDGAPCIPAGYSLAGLCALYAAQGIETTFEINPGNHFQDAELRLAKGVAWILEGT